MLVFNNKGSYAIDPEGYDRWGSNLYANDRVGDPFIYTEESKYNSTKPAITKRYISINQDFSMMNGTSSAIGYPDGSANMFIGQAIIKFDSTGNFCGLELTGKTYFDNQEGSRQEATEYNVNRNISGKVAECFVKIPVYVYGNNYGWESTGLFNSNGNGIKLGIHCAWGMWQIEPGQPSQDNASYNDNYSGLAFGTITQLEAIQTKVDEVQESLDNAKQDFENSVDNLEQQITDQVSTATDTINETITNTKNQINQSVTQINEALDKTLESIDQLSSNLTSSFLAG